MSHSFLTLFSLGGSPLLGGGRPPDVQDVDPPDVSLQAPDAQDVAPQDVANVAPVDLLHPKQSTPIPATPSTATHGPAIH